MIKLLVIVAFTQGSKAIFGDSIRIEKISESLKKSGLNVSELRLPSITRTSLFKYENSKTIFLNIIPLHKSNNLKPTFTSNSMIRQIEFSLSLNHLVRALRGLMPDVVLAETSQVGWITKVAAKKLSIPCIVDVHGLAFAEAKESGQENWRQILNIEREAFEDCDYLTVVSEKMKEYLSKEFKIPNKKMTVIPNGSDPQQTVAKYKKPLKVIYAGTFSYWEKVHDFLDLAKYADPKLFKFYLAGAGSLKNQLIERIRKENIPITYLGYIPRQQIYTLLSKMQVGVAPSTKDLARQVASPIKIFDYMASGLPLITPKIGDWGDIVEEENCGTALEDDSTENYVKALKALSQENIWTTKSKNAIKAVQEKYNWNKALEPITNLLLAYENREK